MALINSYITTDYFIGDISIPNVTSADVIEQLEVLITKQQSIFLTDLLGYEFFDTVLGQTNFGNDPIDGVSAIYTSLIQGSEYTMSDGVKNKTLGLTGEIINVAGGGYLTSPIANYCYYQYMRQMETQTTGTGEAIVKPENSIRVNSNSRMAFAWNEMVDMNWVMHDFLVENESDYPDYIGHTYSPVLNPLNSSKLEPNQKLFVKQNYLGL